MSWDTIFTGRNIKNKVTCRAILWWTFSPGEYSHLTTTFSMYLHAVLHYIWKPFSEGNDELQERAESQQTLENQSAEEEAIIYLQWVGNAICNCKIGFLHSWETSMTSLIWHCHNYNSVLFEPQWNCRLSSLKCTKTFWCPWASGNRLKQKLLCLQYWGVAVVLSAAWHHLWLWKPTIQLPHRIAVLSPQNSTATLAAIFIVAITVVLRTWKISLPYFLELQYHWINYGLFPRTFCDSTSNQQVP